MTHREKKNKTKEIARFVRLCMNVRKYVPSDNFDNLEANSLIQPITIAVVRIQVPSYIRLTKLKNFQFSWNENFGRRLNTARCRSGQVNPTRLACDQRAPYHTIINDNECGYTVLKFGRRWDNPGETNYT